MFPVVPLHWWADFYFIFLVLSFSFRENRLNGVFSFLGVSVRMLKPMPQFSQLVCPNKDSDSLHMAFGRYVF